MPTLTFYATDEVAMQLEKIIEKRSKKFGFSISRGDILVPHIKRLFKQDFGAHWVAPDTTEKPAGEGSGQLSAVSEEKGKS